jgi:Flp pilus assembly protein CpaB
MNGNGTGTLSRLFHGKRAGTTLMIFGAVLAAMAFLLVMGMARRTQAAATQSVRQIYVVTAIRDIPQFTTIRADALAIKAFPAAYAPPGVATKIEDIEGKFAATNLVRDQIVLATQATTTRRTANLSASIPPGKVAFWMPLPDLLVQSGGLQAGDHVDILLSLAMTVPSSVGVVGNSGREEITGVTTQTTLQNVEVFFAGAANSADLPPDAAPAPGAAPAGKQPSKVVAFLLDPQDAVLAKWVKDSGGVIDLVLRSDSSAEPHQTQSVNADSVIEQFRFRIPEQWSIKR